MKLVIDIPEPLLKKVRGEIENGDYETAQEFVRVSVENQIELGSRSSGKDEIPTIDEIIDKPLVEDKVPSQQSSLGEFSIPDEHDIQVCEKPKAVDLSQGPLWGQYNRIFPVKLVVRVLAIALASNDKTGIPLEGFQDQAASRAREFGLKMKDIDSQKSRSRGEKLSAGLPVGDDAAKSIDRFLSHFVGLRDGNGNLKGAPAQLSLINIFGSESERIGLTEKGREFALLDNPLLDESPEAPNPLSEDEKQFYMEHTSETRRGEFDAIISVANLIADGTDRPEKLTSEVAKLNSDWSQAQANTVRTGLLSRMFELRFVSRRRVGQRGIAYDLTDEGKKLINNE